MVAFGIAIVTPVFASEPFSPEAEDELPQEANENTLASTAADNTNDIILFFEEGFFIDKTHPKNNTGEHQFSTCSAIILQDGKLISSEERLMDGKDSPSHSIHEE